MIWVEASVAIATLAVAVIVGRSRKKISAELARSWWDSYWSVLLSALMAISGGLFLFFLQMNSEENKKRIEYMQLLSNEISFIEGSIDKRSETKIIIGQDTLKTKLLYLPYIILEDAGRSGLFPQSRSWNMLGIAALIHEHEIHTDYLISSMAIGAANPDVQSRISHAVKLLNQSRSNILQGVRAITNQMNLPKPEMLAGTFSPQIDTISKQQSTKE